MRSPGVVAAVLLIFVCTVPCRAGVVPGRWEKLESQPAGRQIIVTLKAGDRMECDFKSSGPDDITVTDPDGKERKVPKSEVLKVISRQKYRDGVLNGTLIGFASGAAFYLAAHAAVCCAPDQAHDAAGAIGWGGVGALVGFLVDKSHKGTEVLYKAP